MKVECVEPAEIVYSFSIKFGDLSAVRGRYGLLGYNIM
jgi:hypothetical protein